MVRFWKAIGAHHPPTCLLYASYVHILLICLLHTPSPDLYVALYMEAYVYDTLRMMFLFHLFIFHLPVAIMCLATSILTNASTTL